MSLSLLHPRFAILALSIGIAVPFSISAAGEQQASAPAAKMVAPGYLSPSEGKAMYVAYCGACHGAQGKGDGPAAQVLKVPPTDLSQLVSKNGGKFPEARFRQVMASGTLAAHGNTEMPVWGGIFRSLDKDDAATALRVESLMNYVGSLNYARGVKAPIGH